MMKNRSRKQFAFARGFSLLEMMVVLGIIAIIAVIAMPSQTATTLKASREQVTEAYTHMDGLQKVVEAYVFGLSECPHNDSSDEELEDMVILAEQVGLKSLRIAKPTAYSGHYTNKVVTAGELDDDGGCTITGEFKKAKVHLGLQGKSLTMVLFGQEDGVSKWACFTDADKTTRIMMPRVCRFSDFATARAAQAPEDDSSTETAQAQ